MTRTIRNLTANEVETLLDWAAREGWNPGLADARAFYAADPTGFFGAFANGSMVAAMAAVAYDAKFGFIGLYICHPHWRGQGIGKAVWDAGMAYLGQRTIGLDAVPQQRDNYARAGFAPAYDTIRMSATLAPDPAAASLPIAQLPAVAGLDASCFPARRDAFLHHWLAAPNNAVMLQDNGETTGYAVLRPCRDGAKLGPLFARDIAAATALLDGLSGPLHIDVPATQTEWLQILTEHGFEPGFRTTRMYRGAPPALRMDCVFGVTSLELG